MAKKKLKPKPISFQTDAAGTIPVGSDAEKDYLQRLRADMNRVDRDYVNYVAKQNTYRQNKEEQKKATNGLNRMYMNQMMLTCAMPLREGVDAGSITQSLCMYLGMRMVSKTFAQYTDSQINKLKYNYAANKAEKAGPDSPEAQRAKDLKFKITMAENGGRTPMTVHGAALMKLGMTEQAYQDMRKPGANVEQIRKQYASAMATIEEQCNDDGISIDAVNKRMRTLVGQMSESDPKRDRMYQQLTNEGVAKGEFQDNPSKPGEKVWHGEYTGMDGKSFEGQFTPRAPLTAEQAASTKLKMVTTAYEGMRQQGVDANDVMRRYEASMDNFNKLCDEDGLDQDDINKRMRIMVGEKTKSKPSYANMFHELSYDAVEKAQPYRDPNDPHQQVWAGEYLNEDGSLFTGAFTPRKPMGMDEAASQKARMVIDAYIDMREPGVDSGEIMERYKADMAALAGQCKADGLHEKDIDRQSRMIIGDLCQKNPDFKLLFTEIANNSVVQSDWHKDASRGGMTWTGEYKTKDGKSFDKMFTPREPKSYDTYMDQITKDMSRQFRQADSADDAFQTLRNYVNAEAAVFHGNPPAMREMTPEYDGIRIHMQCMHSDCCYADKAISQMEKAAASMTNPGQKAAMERQIELYRDINDGFNGQFKRDFPKTLEQATGRMMGKMKQSFVSTYGDPKEVTQILRTANTARETGGPVPQSVCDFYSKMMRQGLQNDMKQVSSVEELYQTYTGSIAGYHAVKHGIPVTNAEVNNMSYQTVGLRTQALVNDCGRNADYMGILDDGFAKMLRDSGKYVDKTVMADFQKKYGDVDKFLADSTAAYRGRAGHESEFGSVRRGYEFDMPDVDKSRFGRGADAARRLGIDFDDLDTQMDYPG